VSRRRSIAVQALLAAATVNGPRVIHVVGGDPAGGAARAAFRIHDALRRHGSDSTLLVPFRAGGVPGLRPFGEARRTLHKCALAAASALTRLQETPTNTVLRSLNVFPSDLAGWLDRSGADLVHLHWVGDETLSIDEIGRIAAPVCWTMHDMWPFCGAEHYDDLQHAGRWRTDYASVTRPPGYRGPDLDAWTWRRKQRAWAGRRFELVGPSAWIAECARGSRLLAHQPAHVIPNCVDTEVFAPVPAAEARAAWGLPPDRKYLLFGAQSGTADPRKGFHLLRSALEVLARAPGQVPGLELLVFGAGAGGLDGLGLPVHHVGSVGDERRLALLYAAADAFAAPSMQDNLPNTVVEALACGTPCVAFATGGMPELLAHRQTGWLAQPFDTDDFCAGLRFVLTASLREPCRERAVARHAMAPVAAAYQALYAATLRQRRGA
jgi:glycosyltransferase involved in cell wall biosynthesis